MNHLRALEKHAAWTRSYGFDRCDVYDGQWRPSSHGRVCSGGDPKHPRIDVGSDCRLPLTPEETTASMWAELNVLKQKPMRPQPPSPQCDIPPRRPSARSPPQQQYNVPRVVEKEKTTVEKEMAKQRSKIFQNELEGRKARVEDGEFHRLERIITEKRGRSAVPATIAPIGKALLQPSNPRSHCSGISFDVRVCVFVWRK